jgi:hypothetical protein
MITQEAAYAIFGLALIICNIVNMKSIILNTEETDYKFYSIMLLIIIGIILGAIPIMVWISTLPSGIK